MARKRIGLIVIAVCAVSAIAIFVGRSTIFASSSSTTGLCVRELRQGQPASLSLTAAAESQSRPITQTTRVSTPSPAMVEQAKAVAEAQLQGGNAVVATVGDQTITLGEFRAQETVVRQLQSSNNGLPQGELQHMPPAYRQQMETRSRLIAQAGTANVALAGLISGAAMYQYALVQGCQASPQEVSARVAQDKALAEKGYYSPLAMSASVYGPEFWTVDYPATIRQLLTTNQLHASLTASRVPSFSSTASVKPPATYWNALNARVIEQVHVTVKDPNAVAPATVSGALNYLKRYFAAGLGS